MPMSNDQKNASVVGSQVAVDGDQAFPLKRALSSFSGLPEGKILKPPTRCGLAYDRVKKRWKKLCRIVCNSKGFAACTMTLTFYALFGDDMRLIFSSKKEDGYFDILTITAMSMFSIEVVAFIGGKPEYLWGFFFWLDILSTVTLVLDITTIGEMLFGDSISSAGSSSGGGSGGGDSAEAARAARMSRAGTKAGRVVRLIRLLRLIKMLKVFKKDNKTELQSYPGEDWDDDDEDSNVQESAVSKKLSEMTTRRVIILVLAILLGLPLFTPAMYQDNLDSAGQFGMNVLYRRWRNGMYLYAPEKNASSAQEYFASTDRQVYEDLFLLYLYKHNWFMKSDDIPNSQSSPQDSFNKLFWLGVTAKESPLSSFVFPRHENYDWDQKWNGHNWNYYSGNIPPAIQTMLRTPNISELCVYDLYKGRSLISGEEDKIVCPEEVRYQERTVVFPQLLTEEEADQITFMFVFDRRSGSSYEAVCNTFQTLFVCLLLSVGSMTFASDANKLVLAPIERMISKLDRIRNNPLEALKIGDEEQAKAARMSSDDDDGKAGPSKLKRLLRVLCPCCKKRLGVAQAQAPEPMETQVLERTIIKIGSLLALGFGAAGAEIIGQNMKDGDGSAAMGVAPGHTVDAVFAFCDIRNFTDATELLQDQVMIFVNRIAAIIHSLCDEFWGNPNKNVGEAFLLVWRLSGYPEAKQQQLTDLALMSLVSMIAKLATSADIAEYRSNAKLLKRIPDYRTRVGFGLHHGWAIEGAIGSEFKIDASYLSPNVNTAARLGSDTTYYGSHIILSDAVINCLSEAIQEECRLIDCVDVSGGAPVKVYTLDLDDIVLAVDAPNDAPVTKASKFKSKFERVRRKNERWSDDFCPHKLFETEPNLVAMRTRYTEEFFCRFHMAYLNYEAGNWPIAKVMLEQTRHLLAIEDGPSSALLRLIQKYGGVPPKDWQGFRRFGVQANTPLTADNECDTACSSPFASPVHTMADLHGITPALEPPSLDVI